MKNSENTKSDAPIESFQILLEAATREQKMNEDQQFVEASAKRIIKSLNFQSDLTSRNVRDLTKVLETVCTSEALTIVGEEMERLILANSRTARVSSETA